MQVNIKEEYVYDFLSWCRKELHETAISCPSCGAPQQIQSSNNPRSQNIALVLAALLGGFGRLGKKIQ